MERMVDAAVALLRERPPEDVTVRDVALRAGHHHRFVVGWFGSKVGLFVAAFERMAADVAGSVRFPGVVDEVHPDAERVVRLMNWLIAKDPAALAGPRGTPLLDVLRRAYSDLGVDDDDARLLAQRLVATVISLVLFPGAIGVQEGDVRRQVELERRLVAALVTSAPHG